MKKDTFVEIIGVCFIAIGIFSILYSIYIGKPEQIFWLCYISLILFGIGIMKEDSNLIISQMSIMTIPLLIWNVDFFYQLITNKSLLGITDYFFSPNHPLIAKLITLQHIYTIPFAFFVVDLLKERVDYKKVLKIAFIQMTLIFLLGRIFTDQFYNVNCVFRNCLPFSTLITYEVAWFIVVFLGILLTTYSLKYIFKKSYKLF